VEAFLRQSVPGYALLSPAEPGRLPLEARDFGMYVGFLSVWVYLIALGRGRAKGMPPWWILLALVIFVCLMGADGINAFLYDLPTLPHLYEPRLELRLATGLLCGIAFTGILTPVVNYSLWRENDTRPIIANWKQFVGGLMILVVLFAINESRLGIFFYPLAIATSASVLILVGMINMVFLLSLCRKEGLAATWRDTLNPFAAGVFFAIIELGILSLVRYAVLGTAVLP
jgi:hypothetical protein